MKLKEQNTYKHLLNFASKTRDGLAAFHVTEEGHVEATNSHFLLRLENRFPKGKEFTFNPRTLKKIEGNYPDIGRLINFEPKGKTFITAREAKEFHDFLKGFNKNSKAVVSIKGKIANISSEVLENKIDSNFKLQAESTDEIKFTCNVQYFKQILAFIIDCAAEPVEISFLKANTPIQFKVEGSFVILLAPIRSSGGVEK